MSVQSDKNGNVIGDGKSGRYTMFGAVKLYGYDTAITANVTEAKDADGVVIPAGNIARTIHATGKGKAFVSDGAKWQYEAVA